MAISAFDYTQDTVCKEANKSAGLVNIEIPYRPLESILKLHISFWVDTEIRVGWVLNHDIVKRSSKHATKKK